jgi:hypothetical protein
MKTENTDMITDNKVFLWIALATGVVLLLPYLAMQFNWQVLDPGNGTNGVNWTLSDFIVMGTLIFGTSSLFVLIARLLDKKYRALTGAGFLLLFLWLWVELAVGLFTNWGS